MNNQDQIVPLTVANVVDIEAACTTTEDGEQLAYVTLHTPDEKMHFVVPSREHACHLSALMLNLADCMDE